MEEISQSLQKAGVPEFYQMSFQQFYHIFEKQAAKLRSKAGGPHTYTLKRYLQGLHLREILQAIRQELPVPVENLEAYRYFPHASEEIKAYVQRCNIALS